MRHRQARRGQRQRHPPEDPARPVAEQGRLLLQPRVHRAERSLRPHDVIGRRLVDLGDDQGQERVGRRQVEVPDQVTERREGADHEDQQQADDQRRQQQAAQHAGLPDPRERQRAAGQHVGQRSTDHEEHGQRDAAGFERGNQRIQRAGVAQRAHYRAARQVGEQRDHRPEQGDPDHGRARRPTRRQRQSARAAGRRPPGQADRAVRGAPPPPGQCRQLPG